MPEAVIDNTELLEKLQNSFLDDEQKKELEEILPDMNDDEKAELSDLIDRSFEELQEANPELKENLKKLNEEYNQKMDQMLKKGNETARKEFEKIDVEETAEELKDIEAEVAQVDTVKEKKVKEPAKKTKKGHTIRNIILILFLLLAIAGGILFALTNLG